ncbi:MAG: hypothetical protein WKF83_11840 [Nocardioidaceae bacterium]
MDRGRTDPSRVVGFVRRTRRVGQSPCFCSRSPSPSRKGTATSPGCRSPDPAGCCSSTLRTAWTILAERLTDLGYGPSDAPSPGAARAAAGLPPPTPLDTAGGGLDLLALCGVYGIDSGDVIVLDSLQRVTSGPENDADTARALDRHTGQPLKRRGVAVVRSDNLGKQWPTAEPVAQPVSATTLPSSGG